jgi:hypothetical protein
MSIKTLALRLAITALGLGSTSGGDVAFAEAAVEAASARWGVPSDLLLAMAFAESRLRISGTERGNRGWIRLVPWRPSRSPDRAGGLVGVPARDLQDRPAEGLAAAAALLATAARSSGVASHAPVTDWEPALAQFNGSADPLANALYVEDVFSVLARGFTTDDDHGRRVRLSAHSMPRTPVLAGRTAPDGVVGAAFAPFVPAATTGFRAARPESPQRTVRHIVIHTTQNTFPVIFEYFRRRGAPVSSHYLIRASDGLTVQMVDERRVAFHDACFNEESIGIEHEGYIDAARSWNSEALYRASARLVRDIAARHAIPLDRGHILGHDEAPDCSSHTDPGPGWDWQRFMGYVNEAEPRS